MKQTNHSRHPVSKSVVEEVAEEFGGEPERWNEYVADVYATVAESVDLPTLAQKEDCEVVLTDGAVVVRTRDAWDCYVDFDAEAVYDEWDVDGCAAVEVYDYVRYTIGREARRRVSSGEPEEVGGDGFALPVEE